MSRKWPEMPGLWFWPAALWAGIAPGRAKACDRFRLSRRGRMS